VPRPPRTPADAGSTTPRTGAPRRAGRPRRDGREVVGDPTEEILAAAARLFGADGVEATTMARLAAEVGLGQSSLYYYFSSRDAVVAELVARANVVPLELVEQVRADGGSPACQLHRFVRGDVEALCALPLDIGEIHRIAARDRERFAAYWSERARLHRALAAIVRAGVEAGQLRDVDPALIAWTLMGNDEGVQNWWRVGPRKRPATVARAVADLAVGGLLRGGEDALDAVVAEAAALG